jgi:hypothetical protein
MKTSDHRTSDSKALDSSNFATKNFRNRNYGRITAWLIAGWFLFALSASTLGWFKNNANRIGVEVATAAVSPILGFALWFLASKSFRQFVCP